MLLVYFLSLQLLIFRLLRLLFWFVSWITSEGRIVLHVPKSFSEKRSLWTNFANYFLQLYSVFAHYCSTLTEVILFSLYVFVGQLKYLWVISMLGQHAASKAPLTSRIKKIVTNHWIVTPSLIQFCCGKEINITYFDLTSMQSSL